MPSRSPAFVTTALASASVLLVLLGPQSSAVAKPRPAATLTASVTSGTAGTPVSLTVRLKDKIRRVVVLEARKGARWVRQAKATSNRRGIASLSTKLPTALGDVQFRARAAKVTVKGTTYAAVKTAVRTVTVQAPAAPQSPAMSAWSAESGVFVAEWTPVAADVSGQAFTPVSYDVELSVPGQAPRVLAWYGAARRDFSPAQLTAILGTYRSPVTIRVRVGATTAATPALARPASEWSAPLTTVIGSPASPTNVQAQSRVDAVDISWSAPADASRAKYLTGYRVYLSSAPNAPLGEMNKVYEGTGTSFTYGSGSYDLVHYFTVVAYWSAGPESDPVVVTGTPISPYGPS
ncbi:exported hypothetical protein [metagenome]|uniref:Fibronectin type-III domain-containing protein n=1 Tax=metagenome TaxID=256318 RepID=A0A2P2CC73_9ZZZZ